MKNKKGQKKERFADVPHLLERIQAETPSPNEYFYDYKLE